MIIKNLYFLVETKTKTNFYYLNKIEINKKIDL